jgi:hypothetical protein
MGLSPQSTGTVLRQTASQAAANGASAAHAVVQGAPLHLDLSHALVGARVATRGVRWGLRFLVFSPVLTALICWPLYAAMATVADTIAVTPQVERSMGIRCEDWPPKCMPTSDGSGGFIPSKDGPQPLLTLTPTGRPARTAGLLADGFHIGAIVSSIGCMFLAVMSLCRLTVRRVKRRGIRGAARGVASDWRAGHRDARQVRRFGMWRRDAWGRQWAAEREAGVPDEELSSPGRIDRWLMRQTRPPKKTRAQRKADRKAKRAERKAGPADYPHDELAEPLVPAGYVPRPFAEPGPPAPNASPSPEAEAWRTRAGEVHADTREFLAGLALDQHARNDWAGYVPPPAPAHAGNGSNGNGDRP